MRKTAPFVAAALLVLGSAGCGWPWAKGTRQKRPTSVPKKIQDRVKEVRLEDVERQIASPQGGLQLVIRTEKDEYRAHEPIALEVRLVNVTGRSRNDKPRDLAVYFEPFAKTPEGKTGEWLFKFRVRSERDQRVHYQSPRFKVPESARADYYHFVTLPPHAFVGRQFLFPPPATWLKPGAYSFLVSYEVSKDDRYVIINRHFTSAQVDLLGIDLAYARIWTGTLRSNRLTFRVRGKKRRWWLF